MAILGGLREYTAIGCDTFRIFAASGTVIPDSLISPENLPLIDPSHNFVSYRQRYQQHPGIPFLQPHIREFEQRGEPVQQSLHRLLQTTTTSQSQGNHLVST